MPIYVQPDSLNLGLELELEAGPPVPALRVAWIRWDSGFRGSGLQPGDRIVALNGKRFTAAELRELDEQVRLQSEPQRWQAAGARDGTQVTLTVRRRVLPGRGFREVDIHGALRSAALYEDDERRRLLGPGGPAEWERESYFTGWQGWYDEVAKLLRSVLDEGWNIRTFGGDYVLQSLREHEERVRLLTERYPGPFAASTQADFAAALDALRGRAYTLGPDALAYRERGQQLVEAVAEAGRAAREAFVAAHAADLLPELPQLDPILENHDHLTGKLVELPLATNREWISQGPRTYFTFNQGDIWMFADAESAGAQAMLQARLRYEQRVSPDVRAEFRFIGRILAEPTLIRISDVGHFGLQVEPAACTVGEAFFVDTTAGGTPSFAGEEQTRDISGPAPPDDAPPEVVVGAFYAALKAGDPKRWESLYSPFSVWFLDDGTPRLNSWYDNRELTWESARRRILGDVVDVQVVWVDDPLAISDGTAYPSAPVIERVTVVVDHIRRSEDGGYRAFCDSFLRRVWTLQRIAAGPWRIADQEGI